MFGKPGWFREKTMRVTVVPATWQGWLYAAAWGAAVTVPTVALMIQALVPEAFIWLTASLGALRLDLRKIRSASRRWDHEQVLVIRE